MPTAVLGANLIDDLIPVVDSIRNDLHPIFGDRQHRAYIVKRSWSGDQIGEGTATLSSEVQILPQPKLMVRDLRGQLRSCGLEEEGDIVLTEVSLTWTEPELYLPTLGESEEYYYRITDAHGQVIRTRYYIPDRPPMTDRDGDVGWVVDLKRVEVAE